MTRRSLPTRSLPDRPNLDQLKRQAKELLEAYRRGDGETSAEVEIHYHGADPATFELHDAQLVLARAYGFDSWPKFKAFVDGVTVQRLVDAIHANDLEAIRAIVDARPELVHFDVAENDEHQALHHAVLQRRPEIVRFLMQHGADAHKGIWPHRGATTAFTLASERGYDEIVRIFQEEEQRRAGVPPKATTADPSTKDEGLLSQAVAGNRIDTLTDLLHRGLDPNESGRVQGLEEVVPTWGGPLRLCAIAGNVAMAQVLLAHGANANTNVYAASSALYEAYRRRDAAMISLLESHGGELSPVAIGDLGLVDYAAKLLARENAGSNVAYDLLWGAIESPSPEIVALVLRNIEWPPDDSRWYGVLENGLYLGPHSDRPRYLKAFQLVADRSDPNIRSGKGTTLLHEIVASRGGLTADDRITYATLLLDRGARLDIRDNLLESTPLGWACRWGRVELVKLFLDRGADPIEAEAQPWARPIAWARKSGQKDVEALIGASPSPHTTPRNRSPSIEGLA
jgi:ankyrin repeat protein